ncbi:hypothetical protein AX15_003952 [Amanita polypyramis BW_CC]|nr:hypothetical protein AX15_003952 [Amanita polypyramis BW_CC]
MSATTSIKVKAKQWANGFLHTTSDNKDVNAPQPPMAACRDPGGGSSPRVDLGLVQSFNTMSLAGNRPETNFVGGFHPDLVDTQVSSPQPVHPRPGPLPRPPAMPLPISAGQSNYSRTMQYALSSHFVNKQLEVNTQSEHIVRQRAISAPQSTSSTNQKQDPAPVAALRGRHKQTQCAAFTKAGKRCTRQIKSAISLDGEDSSSDKGVEMIARYCFQHIKEINTATGFYARKNGVWIDYKNWIPDHLLPETQAALRAEMEKVHSTSDTPGYIYTFEIREPGLDAIKFKVGRATNHVRRLDQWGKQCGSKEQVRLGIHPEPNTGDTSNLRGLQELDPTKKVAWCHRLERLVHLELADVTATEVYLDPGWPTPKTFNRKNKPVHNVRMDDTRGDKPACSDCGCVHKEVFEFKRIKRGRYKGKEYELIVKPIIEKWGGFVDDFV